MEAIELLQTNLSKFSTDNYKAGPKWKVIFWYTVNHIFFNTMIPWPYQMKTTILRWFGAKIGKGLIIKTYVRIKNPWFLTIGNHCWIGESVWIDNLDQVEIGNNVCLSQGSMLLTGNHDYSSVSFPYRLGKIDLKDGVWIGAKSVVCPGITCLSHAILTVNSVATKNLDAWSIYTGNPASFIRRRKMKS